MVAKIFQNVVAQKVNLINVVSVVSAITNVRVVKSMHKLAFNVIQSGKKLLSVSAPKVTSKRKKNARNVTLSVELAKVNRIIALLAWLTGSSLHLVNALKDFTITMT